MTVRVAIATPLEDEHVERLRAVDSRLEIGFEPDLLPPVRFPGDHRGVDGFARSAEQERRWQALLAGAEVLFGLPGDAPEGLAAAVRANPGLRWVQGTAAGTGQQVAAAELTEAELERVAFTSTSGVHAGPLAEFCLLGLLAFAKDLPRLQDDRRARRWAHRPTDELRGATLAILGLGAIGTEVARLAKAFGMRTIGVNRRGASDSEHVDEAWPPDRLDDLLGAADALVVTLPLTSETRGLLDAEALAALRPGAIVVNVGRGGVIDEPALVAALLEGRLRGAALDVTETEPPAPDSPLWELPNVLLSPHTAALSWRENERITELFADNLGRWLRGEPLLRRVDTALYY